jgi:hypothetical protein
VRSLLRSSSLDYRETANTDHAEARRLADQLAEAIRTQG